MSSEEASVAPTAVVTTDGALAETFPEDAASKANASEAEAPAKTKCGCTDPRTWSKQSWTKFGVLMALIGVIL